MVRVVVDTDFLSAFLKTESLDLVRDYFQVEKLLVPGAVYRELAVTSLLPRLAATTWLKLRRVDRTLIEAAAVATRAEFADLGAGEREAIALAAGLDSALEEKDHYGFPAEIRRRLIEDEA